jgi:hypothetical protein
MMEVARAVEKSEFIVFRCYGCVGFSVKSVAVAICSFLALVLANVPRSSSQFPKVEVDIRYHPEGLWPIKVV